VSLHGRRIFFLEAHESAGEERNMFGFVVGSVCLIALFKLHHMRRMAWAHGHGFHGSHHGHHHGWGRFGGRGSWAGPRRGLYHLLEALDATPAQEKVIMAAVEEVRAAAGELRGEFRQSRVDLAQAFRAASFDAEVMGNAFARHDEQLETLRKAVTGALAKVHDALDERQRARLAEWLDSRGGFGSFFGGVYR
jgi:uncharacterized membrane protein